MRRRQPRGERARLPRRRAVVDRLVRRDLVSARAKEERQCRPGDARGRQKPGLHDNYRPARSTMISPIAMARLLRDNDGGRGPTLRELIAGPEMVLAPGCYDALGARLVEEAGFPAVYMTGFGSAASRLGRPDVGLMSLPEMVDNAHRIAEAVDIHRRQAGQLERVADRVGVVRPRAGVEQP